MLVTPCPRCHESVRVPDAMLTDGGSSQAASVQAKCPWCLETLDSRELNAALPPALTLVGEAATLEAGVAAPVAASDEGWGSVQAASVGFEEPGEPDDLGELDSSEFDEMEELDDLDGNTEDDVSEFMIEESGPVASSHAVAPKTKSPEIMMDVADRRRKRSGSPIKTMIGVAAGGLLALPIVGVILHFATGQYVPIVSDVLPAVGSSKPQLRANVPMSLDNQEPRGGEDEPISGRPIGGEPAEDTAHEAATDPAAAALSAIAADDSEAMPTLDFGAPLEDDSLAARRLDSESDAELDAQADAANIAAMSAPEPEADTNDLLNESAPADASGMTDASDAVAELAKPALPDMAPDFGADLFDSAAAAEPAAESAAAPEQPAPESADAEPSAIDVDAEMQKWGESLAAVNAMAASAAGRGEAVQDLYESLAQLAAEVPSDSVAKLQPVLKDLSSNMGLVVAFAKASPDWISRSSEERGSDGAVVVGKLSGDSPEAASIRLSNHQEIPVNLPASMTEVPSGIQIGLGRVEGSGRDATLTLELLESVSP